jgi:hypothetical protein
MADFNRKKLQVFVSSTFSDLIQERQAAVEAILTAGHIPAGMELFTAGDESQMEVIKQWIDESDVYLLILGGRYGSMEPTTGKSYTQLEYEYALSKGKPLFACVIQDAAIEARVKSQGRSALETDNPQRLKEFRAVVLSKMSKFWEDSKDIKIAVTETLSHLARRQDLVGWVRPSAQSNLPALADEIARLSRENAQLRAQLAGAVQEELIKGLTFLDLKAILDGSGATEVLVNNRHLLGSRDYTMQGTQRGRIEELCMRGLLEQLQYGRYQLTDAGRVFLNKYDASQRSAKAALRTPGNRKSIPKAKK